MKKPMTTDEAYVKYGCPTCNENCNLWEQGGITFCVESSTCSFRSPCCNKRVWFQGDLKDSPANFPCPYCGTLVRNKYATRRWKP